jgi:CRP-like cAMP-binding protein
MLILSYSLINSCNSWHEVYPQVREILHCKPSRSFINMGTMLKQDCSKLPIFAGLAPAEMHLVEPLLDLSCFQANETIFEQGQIATFLYILLRGEVVVRFKPYDGPPLTVAHIVPGGVFGWSAALGRSAYTSGAEAVTEIEAVCIRGDRLYQLCQDRPEIGVVILERLASVIAERLRSTHTQILSILASGMSLNEECRKRLAKND